MAIRKRTWGDGKQAWVVDYRDQNGTRRMKTFRTKKDASAWAIEAGHQVAQGTHVAESASITFAKAAELWVGKGEADGLEAATIAQRRQHVAHLAPILGTQTLARLSTPRLQEIRDWLVATMSRALARKVLTSLRAILGEAQRRGYVAQNAAAGVRIETSRRHLRRLQIGVDVPSKEEVRAMLVHAQGRWRPLLITGVFTGLRASELRGLRWADVDLAARMLHVRQRADRYNAIGRPKSHAGERSIPLSPMVVNTLKEWRLSCPKGELDLVFPNGHGNVEALANIWRRGFVPVQIAALGEAKYGVHALRHFCASHWIELGFAPKKVQALMGHASITMTFDLYGHLFPNEKDDLARMADGERALMG